MPSSAATPGRCALPHACYVVISFSTRQCALLAHSAHAQEVVRWLRTSDAEKRTESLAWVVMPDCVHWLFRLRGHRLSTVIRTLKSRSARALHERTASRGRIWQPGYHDQRPLDERQLLACATYILSTPMRAGLASGLHGYPFA